MSALLELEVGSESIDRVDADLVVVGLFADERPLRGPAGRADWRLCGLFSSQLGSERLRGEPGDAVLVATFGRLTARHVLALGLGERASFTRDDLRGHVRDALCRSARLGARSAALAPLGLLAVAQRAGATAAGSRPSAAHARAELNIPERVEDFVSAALEGLRSAGGELRIRLLVDPEDATQVAQAVAEAVAGSPDVTFERAREAFPAPALRAATFQLG